MYIKIGKGLNNVYFGSSIDDITDKFGKPDKICTNINEDIQYLYFNEKLVFQFEQQVDMKLGWIEVHNKNIGFEFYQNPWSMDKEQLLQYILNKLVTEYTMNDYGSIESIFFEKIELELQFFLGKLKCINFGFLFNSDNCPIFMTNT